MAAGLDLTDRKARISGSPIVVDPEQQHHHQHHHQRQHSHAAAAAQIHPHPRPLHHDVVGGGDDDGEDIDASSSRSTIAHCSACGAGFGEFFNSWRKVTGSYYLPSLVGSYGITGLHPKGKPKPASTDSALVGCSIQPLVCNSCDDTLGIVCTRAPESKRAYADREFFKLPKIQLRSDVTGKEVDAIIEDHQQNRAYSQEPSMPSGPPMDSTSEASAHQPSTASSMTIHSSKPPEELRRHDPILSRPIASHAPLQKPVHQDRESAPAPPPPNRHNDRVVPLASPVNGHMQTNGFPAPGGYPTNLAVKLDAIDRIQTQVNLNRATLESCTRDISRLDGILARFQQSVMEHIEAVRMDLLASRQQAAVAAASIPQGDRLDDHALEIFSNTLSNVATKANEVDSLKVQLEMIKRKLKRMEEGNNPGSATADRAAYPAQVREASVHHTPIPQQALTPTVHHITPPSRPDPRPHGSYPPQHPAYTPEVAQPPHPLDADSAQSGWVTVNPSAKRSLPNGVDGRSDAAGTPVGSPKRPKLAPLEPRHAYEPAPGPGPIRFERTETDESTPSQPPRYRTESNESYPDSTNPSTFIPYTTEGHPDDSWRPESQRAVSNPAQTIRSPRGRGRGRGGRPRKSLPVEVHSLGTPEWEKETWTGSQIGPDGYYHPVPNRGGLVRRGSGGAQGHQPMATSPQASLNDPYGHTKKTRTKPIRNADGVLIRKDGRPDMRSQSSAANLRKVHARKEEEKRIEASVGHTPTSSLAAAPMNSADSPTSQDSHDAEMSSTQERTNHILKQMFPNGVDEQRARLYTSEQYFPASHSPAESKSVITQSETPQSRDSEERSRETSEGDGDERMEDRPPLREDSIQRHTLEAAIAPLTSTEGT